MRYTGDEYSPMYRIMIHDEYGMTMRDLIRECMLVIGSNMMDLLWRYWTVLGPAPFHTLPPNIPSSFRRWGPPLTAIARKRCERTMRRRFYLSASPSIFSSILERKFYHFKLNFHICATINLLQFCILFFFFKYFVHICKYIIHIVTSLDFL